MNGSSGRLLELLGLLTAHRECSGHELATRLGVSTRTVRRDIDRLREMGYPVSVEMGPSGGYRLEDRTNLPPLLLSDEEAVAVAVGLRTASGSGVSGIGETVRTALDKLEEALPRRLWRRIEAMRVSTVIMPDRPSVAVDQLGTVVTACRDHQELGFDYRNARGGVGYRRTQPHELVTWGDRWYLVAWDLDRADWRTFRVDRLSCRLPVGPYFTPREIPGGDPAAYVARQTDGTWPWRTTLKLKTGAESPTARALMVYGNIESVDESTCLFRFGAGSLDSLAFVAGAIDVDFEIIDPPELADQLREVVARFQRAVGDRDLRWIEGAARTRLVGRALSR